MACCCGLCVPNMTITKANAKDNLGEIVVAFHYESESEIKSPDFLVPTLCRADLRWIVYFGPAIVGKLPANFDSEFWWWISIANFSALFFQGFRPPKKFTPKIHGQNCRIPLQFHFLEPKMFSRRFSAYRGDQDFHLDGGNSALVIGF